MMRNLIIAAIGAGLLAIGGTANAQPVIVGGSGPAQPPPGSGDSARASAIDRDLQSATGLGMLDAAATCSRLTTSWLAKRI